jgi:hypothetical protein
LTCLPNDAEQRSDIAKTLDISVLGGIRESRGGELSCLSGNWRPLWTLSRFCS